MWSPNCEINSIAMTSIRTSMSVSSGLSNARLKWNLPLLNSIEYFCDVLLTVFVWEPKNLIEILYFR